MDEAFTIGAVRAITIIMNPEERVRRTYPASLLAVPLAGLAYLTQTIPILGVFLMMLMAVAWPGILLLIAVVGTTIEAAIGRVSRWWLVLPLVTLGTYEGFALVDHLRAWNLDGKGRPAPTPMTAGRDVVILDKAPTDLAATLVRDHHAGTIYQSVVESGVTTRYLSTRLIARQQCGIAREGVQGRLATATFFHMPPDATGRSRLDPGACILTMDDVPTAPYVAIRYREADDRIGSLPVVTRTAVVSAPGSPDVEIVESVSRPLSWMPLILAGCGLDSATPAWRCGVSPSRDRMGDIDGVRMADRIASVLGFSPRRPGEVPVGDATSIMERAAERVAMAEADVDKRDSELLDRLIADPAAHVPADDFERTARRPRVVGPRLANLEILLNAIRDAPAPRTATPTPCPPHAEDPRCRATRVARNAVQVDHLLRWRIDASLLATTDRRELEAIRNRMRSRDRNERMEARDRRMARISERNRRDAMRQRER